MENGSLEPIVAALRESLPELVVVYLFGSQARGDAAPDSDVDLAVLGPSPVPPVLRWEIQERLASLLHAAVDLVDLRAAPSVLRVEVLRSAVVLFEADRRAREVFEATALAAYARLQEERRGILEDVRRTGHVYR
jgi:predicted nucleotidyltransferase